MRHLLLSLPLLLLPSLASAQAQVPLELPFLDKAETRFGDLSVGPVQLDGLEGQGFFVDDRPVDGLADIHAHIQAVLPMPQGGAADWVLVSLASGGNDCPIRFAFIVVSEAGAKASDLFGTCSEAILNLRETEASKLALDMIGQTDGVIGVHVYRFDGVTLDESVSPLP